MEHLNDDVLSVPHCVLISQGCGNYTAACYMRSLDQFLTGVKCLTGFLISPIQRDH